MSVTLVTNLGDVKLELFCEQVPKAAKNFLGLCAAGYYNGTKFHRNIPDFMIQGGDTTGTGKGGQSIYGSKYFEDEIVSELKHDKRGIEHSHLNNAYTIFAQFEFFVIFFSKDYKNLIFSVISGLETLDKMEKIPVDAKDRPLRDIIIENVIIHANPFADRDDE